MRVLVAGSGSIHSGREEIHWTQAITEELKSRNFEVDSFILPFVNSPLLIPEQMMALRLLDCKESCDMLLTIGYPSFVINHPHKRSLLFSLASSLHEHYDSEYGVLATPEYHRLRSSIYNAERKCLSETEKIYCASDGLAQQLSGDFNLDSTVLSLDDCAPAENATFLPPNSPAIVCETTLEPADRIDLLLSSVARSQSGWQLKLFIPPASIVYMNALSQQIERIGIKQRIKVIFSPLSAAELNKACAYITLPVSSTRIPESLVRALKLSTPIIATTDSGAILEIVDESNGIICKPETDAITSAMDHIIISHNFRKQMKHSDRSKLVDYFSDVKLVTERMVG